MSTNGSRWLFFDRRSEGLTNTPWIFAGKIVLRELPVFKVRYSFIKDKLFEIAYQLFLLFLA